MGHDHQRGAGAGQFLDHAEHFGHQFRVQRRGRLVEQQHFRLQGQRAGNRHALLLAARQLAREGIGLVGQAHPRQQRARLLLGLRARHAAHGDGRLDDVLQRGQVREQVEALEHHAHLGAATADLALRQLVQGVTVTAVADQLAADGHVAAVGAFQVVDQPQQRGLAGAGRANQHAPAGRRIPCRRHAATPPRPRPRHPARRCAGE
ncbi:hypothetical protein G6F68_013501 [Rhizopus microsporus]|nr:hypothetical protein G6F68_013501 [Rhizopus microsporus]